MNPIVLWKSVIFSSGGIVLGMLYNMTHTQLSKDKYTSSEELPVHVSEKLTFLFNHGLRHDVKNDIKRLLTLEHVPHISCDDLRSKPTCRIQAFIIYQRIKATFQCFITFVETYGKIDARKIIYVQRTVQELLEVLESHLRSIFIATRESLE